MCLRRFHQLFLANVILATNPGSFPSSFRKKL